MESPAKKLKLSPSSFHHRNDENVQFTITDLPSSFDDPQFSLLKKQLGGEKVRSVLTDFKLIHSIKDETSQMLKPTSVVACNKTQELFVACIDSSAIRVHDLKTREFKRQISTDKYMPVRLFVDEEGEFIVFTTNRENDWAIVKLDLKEEKVVWKVLDGSPKAGLAFKKSTNEVFVADWEGHRILVLDAMSGSLKYEIFNEKTKGALSLYYEEKTNDLYLFTSLSLRLGNENRGNYFEQCFLLRFYGENYVDCEVIMEFDEQKYGLNNNGFSSIILNLNMSYFLLSQETIVYLFDRNTKKLITTINTKYEGCREVHQYSYNEFNNEIYRFGGYDEYVEVMQLSRVENNFIDIPLDNKTYEAIKKLGGTFPKVIQKYRYNNDYVLSDALAYFMSIQFEKHTMFRYSEDIENLEEEEEELKEKEEEMKDTEDESDNDEDDGIDLSLDDMEDEPGYSQSFPFKYSHKEDTKNSFDSFIEEWLSQNPDGMIIGGNFSRTSMKKNEFAIAVKVSESNNADFPVYIIYEFSDVLSCKLSTLVSNLKSVCCFEMTQYHIPKKAKYEINFTELYKKLLSHGAINSETKEIDNSLLLKSYRRLISTDVHRHMNNEIFTMCTLIFQEETINFDGAKFRKTDLIVLGVGLDLGMIRESNKRDCIVLRFDDQEYDDVLV